MARLSCDTEQKTDSQSSHAVKPTVADSRYFHHCQSVSQSVNQFFN